MGEYSDVKRKKLFRLLNWLSRSKQNISIRLGGKHTWIVDYDFWPQPFPLPLKHGVVNKHIVKDLMEKLVSAGICTKEEFDSHIK